MYLNDFKLIENVVTFIVAILKDFNFVFRILLICIIFIYRIFHVVLYLIMFINICRFFITHVHVHNVVISSLMIDINHRVIRVSNMMVLGMRVLFCYYNGYDIVDSISLQKNFQTLFIFLVYIFSLFLN